LGGEMGREKQLIFIIETGFTKLTGLYCVDFQLIDLVTPVSIIL
jgi:hypothetical protein